MNDIEQRLSESLRSPKPRRDLSASFTERVMARVEAADQPRPSLFARLASVRTIFTMHKLTKPAALVIGVTAAVVSVGTGYAALQWLQPKATIDKNSVVTLPNGNKRLWVHFDSCQGQDRNEPSNGHYEIKAGSDVTPEELRVGLEADCEDDLLMELFPQIERDSKSVTDFKAGDKQYYTPYVRIKEVGRDYIITQSHLNGKVYDDVRLPVDRGAKFFSKGEAINLSDFKAGDWVTLVSYTKSLDRAYATEAMTPEQLETLSENGFPKGTHIEGMIKRQYDPAKSMELMGVMGEDWTRLVEDKNAPDGWRQLIPFDRNWPHQ